MILQDALEFVENDFTAGQRIRYRYETVLPGRPSSHNEDTCAYCQQRYERDEAERRRQMEELEPLFEEAGVGRSHDDEVDMDDALSEGTSDDMPEYDQPIEDEAYTYGGPCTGVQDIVFTGLTEERHGNAWCHYMYYGRLREWDGLIVLIGVPVSAVSNGLFPHMFTGR